MASELPGFDVDGIRVWPDTEQANIWRWLPGAPSPQAGPDGRPQVSLIVAGAATILQLGVCWTASQDALDAVRKSIARKAGADPATLALTPADACVDRVALLLGPQGALEEAAAGPSSGTPPYMAALGATLAGPRAEAALAALDGQSGRMAVRYEATVALSVVAEAALTGDLAAALPGLTRPDSDEEARGAVDELVEAGALTWLRTADPDAPESLRVKASDAARERAAQLLAGMIADASRHTLDAAKLDAKARMTAPLKIAIVRECDVASWFGGGKGAAHVQRFG